MRELVAWAFALLAGSASATGWEYATKTDAMSSKSVKSATLVSENSVQLKSPYAGGTYAQLSVRQNANKSVDVAVLSSNGQVMCHSFECKISIRFDETQAQTYGGGHPSDNSSNVVFLNNEARFIAQAKKAKKILVQMTYFQNGSQLFEFAAPTPLSWPPK